ncbi:MAG: zinc ribbon domain-containing protein [Dehalococcoidia bacterium]|nr:zinc ribbon domain-containing protein [Dehalococcoidia bacterium]
MPIYEYQCTQCGEKLTVRQSIGEDGSQLKCPKCHAGNLKRLISSFFGGGSGSSELSGSSCVGPT